MKQIYLVRHCQATGQEAAAPLTETGIQQAEQLVSFFEDMAIDRLFPVLFIGRSPRYSLWPPNEASKLS